MKLAMFVKELYQTVLPDFKHLYEKKPTCNGKKIPVSYGSLDGFHCMIAGAEGLCYPSRQDPFPHVQGNVFEELHVKIPWTS